ncbi:MAG: hypothetical protein J5449_09265, partial [Oscillospiraceae bacterium]|nr:hypothetical protein [Oscillospiraceae bacterium]
FAQQAYFIIYWLHVNSRLCAFFSSEAKFLLASSRGLWYKYDLEKRDEGENSVHVSPQRGSATGCKPPAKTPLGSLRSGREEMRGHLPTIRAKECARAACEQGWYRGYVFRPLLGWKIFFLRKLRFRKKREIAISLAAAAATAKYDDFFNQLH